MKKKLGSNAKLAANTIRVLAAAAIAKAKSGHPGVALGAADIMYELFANQMNASPTVNDYFNRDRFVLSCGHGSSLLYATMLVCGYKDIKMGDLKEFRQIDSKTPGHPEPKLLQGVEVSSGPLGQGIAMAVGLAIASKKMANIFNTPKIELFNNYTYCLFGDGCFEEGISYEAIAVAGRLQLNKLIMIYDFNGIQLDGKVSDSTAISVSKYFRAMGWNVVYCPNGHSNRFLKAAFARAKASKHKPTVIIAKTHIGYGSVNVDTNKAHGTYLTDEQVDMLKKTLKFDYPNFTIPSALSNLPKTITDRVEKKIIDFNNKVTRLEKANLTLYEKLMSLIERNKINFDRRWFEPASFPSKDATRKICGNLFQAIADNNENLICSIADVSSSTMIKVNNSDKIRSTNWEGQNLDCGVREFAMAAINNGIVAYGGMKAVGSAFLSFSDYNKAAIRLAAISGLPTVNIFSHDSITVGEDGPTHQPIEQIWAMRLIPNHMVFRPTSSIDTVVALEHAFKSKHTPVTIITSRQAFDQVNVDYELAKRGAYVVRSDKNHKITLYATGSELPVALQVATKLDIPSRVVAINSLELLQEQDLDYQEMIFDKSKKISIEYGATAPWYRYVDLAIGLDEFGYAGKPDDVVKKLGLTCGQIANKINKWLDK
ncbi:MAG: transketolase-like TK C-terminal-containing protein [Mycoplasmoidaceae bacterium]